MAVDVTPKSVCDAPHPKVDKDSSGKVVYCPKPNRKIISIGFVDSKDKHLPGIDKEGKVKLKIEVNNKYNASDELFINLDDSTDIEFEYDGNKITGDDYLKITSNEKQVELSAKFKIQ
mgnify:CR=1 FL=1